MELIVKLAKSLLFRKLIEGYVLCTTKGLYKFVIHKGVEFELIEVPLDDGMAHMAPRSFFGVEDFLDDDNSRPYTYQKGKKSKNPNKHISFKQRTIAYMEPFTLDVFISKRFVSASLTHRVTSKQVAVAGTNSKDIKAVLRSRSDIPACIAIGRILSERAREADVYTASYTPRDRDKFEGKIRAVVQSLIDNGIDIKH
ncbi:unnamed protein product [Sphenostylis stenocarpa]|uniref:L18 ribosomal protein Heart Stopper n=1 Tax=Sphenostylis stenocarpa TaxID=92480 RepID=A0AA86SPC0_9FABA|nr:unnamed protein product [Sphenostylis stenocarpa]